MIDLSNKIDKLRQELAKAERTIVKLKEVIENKNLYLRRCGQQFIDLEDQVNLRLDSPNKSIEFYAGDALVYRSHAQEGIKLAKRGLK